MPDAFGNPARCVSTVIGESSRRHKLKVIGKADDDRAGYAVRVGFGFESFSGTPLKSHIEQL